MGPAWRVDEHTCPFTTSPSARCALEWIVGKTLRPLATFFTTPGYRGSSKYSKTVQWSSAENNDFVLQMQILRRGPHSTSSRDTYRYELCVWIGLVLEICYRIGTSNLLSGLCPSTTNYTIWHTVAIMTLLLMMSVSVVVLIVLVLESKKPKYIWLKPRWLVWLFMYQEST